MVRTLTGFVGLMLHKQGAQLVLLRFGPGVLLALLVGGAVLRVVAVCHLRRLFRRLPEEQFHVGLGIALGDRGEATEYEARERC